MSSPMFSGNSSPGSNSGSFSLEGTQEFLNSNSLVAKFAFLLLILIVFVLALRAGIQFLTWLFTPSGSPHLLDGMIDAQHMKVITQDPATSGSIPIIRSNNQLDGIEFTWSIWIYIDNLDYGAGTYRHIFHKGNDDINYTKAPTGLNFPNNGPGLYITPNENNLLVIMNTFENIEEKIILNDVPLNKWINVIIRCEQNIIDCYINGTVTKRHELSGVPFQNYGNVYMSMNGGFDGYSSNLWYYDYALGTSAIQRIVDQGPNMSMDGSEMSQEEPRYFSLRWFFANTNSQNAADYGGI
tara:strand:+ start:1159 stop:2049 length:891 start_codon:yes stop_codon:yes gene_type:complete